MTNADWRPARIAANEPAAADMIALSLEPFDWIPHEAGQHYDIRFPGEELSRAYSVVSGPARLDLLEFGVQVLPGGMISPRLARTVPGDRMEIRGPLGQSFIWRPEHGRSLILLGAGAGITPLLSIHQHFSEVYGHDRSRFLMTAKTPEKMYRYERHRDALTVRFTASEPRITKADLSELLSDLLADSEACARICGPIPFMLIMVESLVDLGFPETRIRSEAYV